MTGIPAVVWAVLWNMVALAILAGSLYLAYRKPPEGIAAEQARPARSGGHAGSP